MFKFIINTINRRVDERLDKVLSSDSSIHLINLDDKNAEKVITEYIVKQKENGNTELSIYDFVTNLRLPASQVDTILGKFEAKKLIKEIQ